jgi:hypothetical protein
LGAPITAKIVEGASQDIEMWFQFFDGSFEQARGLGKGGGIERSLVTKKNRHSKFDLVEIYPYFYPF